jgi:hypothetical protein
MWTVVYIAPNRVSAENLKNVLVKEGVLVQLRPVGLPQSGDANSVEVLVPESEVEEAHELLAASLGA